MSRCEHEELTCLRSGVWSYHTALVKVVSAQRDSGVQNLGKSSIDSLSPTMSHASTFVCAENLPQDYQDTCPTSFGHDPLDFLHFLVAPGISMMSSATGF